MPHDDSSIDNPYRSPRAPPDPRAAPPLDEAARFACPVCRRASFPFWKLYLWNPWYSPRCPACRARLKIRKREWYSTYAVSMPLAIVGGALVALHAADVWPWDDMWPVIVAVLVLVGALTLVGDFYVDRRTVYLAPRDQTTSAQRGQARENDDQALPK